VKSSLWARPPKQILSFFVWEVPKEGVDENICQWLEFSFPGIQQMVD